MLLSAFVWGLLNIAKPWRSFAIGTLRSLAVGCFGTRADLGVGHCWAYFELFRLPAFWVSRLDRRFSPFLSARYIGHCRRGIFNLMGNPHPARWKIVLHVLAIVVSIQGPISGRTARPYLRPKYNDYWMRRQQTPCCHAGCQPPVSPISRTPIYLATSCRIPPGLRVALTHRL